MTTENWILCKTLPTGVVIESTTHRTAYARNGNDHNPTKTLIYCAVLDGVVLDASLKMGDLVKFYSDASWED